jgi:hypothetical protein
MKRFGLVLGLVGVLLLVVVGRMNRPAEVTEQAEQPANASTFAKNQPL